MAKAKAEKVAAVTTEKVAAAPVTEKATKRPRKTTEEQFRMAELITVVQDVTSLSRRESKVAIQAVIYSIKKGITDKGFVKIPGFGKFIKVHKNASERKSFGKMTSIPEKDIIKFRPLKSLKQLVDGQIALENYDDEAAANSSEE